MLEYLIKSIPRFRKLRTIIIDMYQDNLWKQLRSNFKDWKLVLRLFHLPTSTRFHDITRVWLFIIPIFLSNEKEVGNDEASADDLKDEQDDEHDVHEVEILSDQE